MKTLTQLSKEELEAFEKGNYFFVIEYNDRDGKWKAENLVINDYLPPDKAFEMAVKHAKEFNGRVSNFVKNEAIKSWLLAHDRRIIEAAFAATVVKEIVCSCGKKDCPAPQEKDVRKRYDPDENGFNVALTQKSTLEQEFLK